MLANHAGDGRPNWPRQSEAAMAEERKTDHVIVETTRGGEDLSHVQRINGTHPNPSYIPGLDVVPPAGKGKYPQPEPPSTALPRVGGARKG